MNKKKKWSRDYEKCTECSTIKVQHWGHGKCKICYEAWRSNLPHRLKAEKKRRECPEFILRDKIRVASKTHKLPKKIIRDLFLRYNSCFYCGKKISYLDKKDFQIEHKVTTNRTDYDNLVVSCLRCNRMKADNTVETLINFLEKITNKRVSLL